MPEPTPSLCESVNPELYLAICVSTALLEANMAAPGMTLTSLTPLVEDEVEDVENATELTDALIAANIIPNTVPAESAVAVVSKAWSNATVPPGTKCCWDGKEWRFWAPDRGYLDDMTPCKLIPPVVQ